MLGDLKWETIVAILGALSAAVVGVGTMVSTYLNSKRLSTEAQQLRIQNAQHQEKALALQAEIEELKSNTTLEINSSSIAMQILQENRLRIEALEAKNTRYETEIQIRREEVFQEKERSDKAIEAERERTEKVRTEKYDLADKFQEIMLKHEQCISDLNLQNKDTLDRMSSEHAKEKVEYEYRIRELERINTELTERVKHLEELIEQMRRERE